MIGNLDCIYTGYHCHSFSFPICQLTLLSRAFKLVYQDAFMGGDHAIVTELGEKQIELAVPGPPALDRAISGCLGTTETSSGRQNGRKTEVKMDIYRLPLDFGP